MSLRKLLKYRAFEKRILSGVPQYSPISGARIEWDISIRQKTYYDTYTGKQTRIGMATVKLNQRPPSSTRDKNIYKYDLKNKTLSTLPGLRWQAEI